MFVLDKCRPWVLPPAIDPALLPAGKALCFPVGFRPEGAPTSQFDAAPEQINHRSEGAAAGEFRGVRSGGLSGIEI